MREPPCPARVGADVEPTAFQFDPTDPETVSAPFTAYDWLLRHDPVHRLDSGDFVVTRDELVSRVLTDSEHFAALSPVPDGQVAPLILATTNPPRHSELRRAVASHFRRKLVREMTDVVQTEVDVAFSIMRASGGGDVVETLSLPVPVAVISDMLGVPANLRPKMRLWSDALMDIIAVTGFGMDRGRAGNAGRLVREFVSYMDDLVSRREAEDPANVDVPADIIDHLLRDDDHDLTHVDVVSIAIFLLVAGHETTANTISAGIHHLLQNPPLAERLRRDDGLMPFFIDEMVRLESPIQRTVRVASSDVEIGGVVIPEGSTVLAYLGAANRDPRQHAAPETIDLSGSRNRHLGFGAGIHFCLGAPLARMEATIVFNRWLEEFPDAGLDPDHPAQWRMRPEPRGLAELSVRL